MTLPIAGWYPDPQDPNRTRWWDGARWGAPAPQPAPVPAPVWEQVPRPPAPSEYRPVVSEPPLRGRQARVAEDRATRAANPYGYAGLVLALIGFLFNVFAIPGILGIVFGVIGLARAGQLTGQRITGFGVSLAAVILGLVVSVAFVARVTQLLG
ncbi:DUF2510 domain-containing protein [Curtobacterium sp. PhB115]|uniref:DUF2510 domain-containing protein n=1 Tax=Curtobacterium sp. PhB115 TaxID=2485173 RepID=UPI000FBFBBCD|nr:DUF2510 domain-containing protein [Curtobacterium sp. PhB115]ROP65344.1 uncharacterized protein DUF2510 [Curtobacterium sp. PhB115]